MLGPNTATGHTSTLLYIEPAVGYAIACMQQVLAGGHRGLDVRPGVFSAYNQRLQPAPASPAARLGVDHLQQWVPHRGRQGSGAVAGLHCRVPAGHQAAGLC